MRLSRGVVLLGIWVFTVAGAPTCPHNCKKNPDLPTCKKDTGDCSRGCVPGYYGNTCNMRCDVNCQQRICQWRDGSCTCKPGYIFQNGSCEFRTGVKCESNDHCLNNTCLFAGRPDCLKGCTSGWFGKICQQSCTPNCNCDEVTGVCNTCIPGWYGADCGSGCSPDCVNINCHTNGTCVHGCTTGTYGDQCNKLCSQHCESGCDQLSGECVQCQAGRYGPTCQSECSAGCARSNNDCDRDGTCTRGCAKGYYGEKCESTCPQQCFGDLCDINGICSACKNRFFGTFCDSTCLKCTDGVCNKTTGQCTKGCESAYYGPYCTETCKTCIDGVCDGTTGECIKGCVRGYFGPFCNQTCELCIDGDCEQSTGECRHNDEKSEKLSGVESWVGGSVAVICIIPIAAGLFYTYRRLKRVNGVVYDIVKWRRPAPSAVEDVRPVAAPGYIELEEEALTNPPRVCPIRPTSQASYIEAQHNSGSGNNLQIQRQLQTVGVSDQQEDEHQAAAVSPSHDVQRRSDESHDRPDSYVLPNYCEVNEELMATLPQPPQGAEAPAPVVNYSPFSVVADVHAQHEHRTDGNPDLTIPLIAECFGATENEDSPPDEEPRPNVENYEHPFKNHYTQF